MSGRDVCWNVLGLGREGLLVIVKKQMRKPCDIQRLCVSVSVRRWLNGLVWYCMTPLIRHAEILQELQDSKKAPHSSH
jgi:hypothetical protein